MHARRLSVNGRNALIILLACLPFIGAAQATAADLFIFFPKDTQKEAVQNGISRVCPQVRITVFERANNFWRTLKTATPDAVLTTGLAFQHLKNYTANHEGILKKPTEHSHHLVSFTQMPPTQHFLNAKRIGVINELGRKSGKQYYKKHLASDIKLKQVSKPRDLIPLLTFNTVDFLMVDDRTRLYLELTSKQKLKTRHIDLNIPLGIAGVHKTASTDIQRALSGCLETLNAHSYNRTYFSLDTWQRL